MSVFDWLSVVATLCGAFFFLAGTVGMLRFPDVYTRLHALTKADNLGLGFVVIGLLFQIDDWIEGIQLVVLWLLALSVSATACHLIAQSALQSGIPPWDESSCG